MLYINTKYHGSSFGTSDRVIFNLKLLYIKVHNETYSLTPND